MNSKLYDRKREIDIAKGIGIISVVYGHTVSSLHLYIYIFHMPLFFIISGFLYASKEREPLVPYVRKKVHSLIFPYLILLVMTNVLLLTLFHFTGQDFPLHKSMLIRPYGAAGALWFLLALFWVTIIYKLIDLYVGYNFKAATVVLFFVIGRILSALGIHIPTFMDTAFTSLIFYLAGIILYTYKNLFSTELILYMLVISLLPCLMIDLPMSIDLMTNTYEPFYYMFLSVSISFLIIRLSHFRKLVNSLVGKLLAYLGRISLVILAFHIFAFEFCYFVVPKDSLFNPEWPYADIIAVGMTIVTISFICLLNKLLKIDVMIDKLSGSYRLTEKIAKRRKQQQD
jgi:fucose 4-O-acetylase-like acetyltransferase